MATRLITVEVDESYFLVLNPMWGNVEGQESFGPFETASEALAFHDGERVEPYSEEGHDHFGNSARKVYSKSFRKGGRLEWMNPLDASERSVPGTFGHGVRLSRRIVRELN